MGTRHEQGNGKAIPPIAVPPIFIERGKRCFNGIVDGVPIRVNRTIARERNGIGIIPIRIQEMNTILPLHQYIPRRGRITISIGAPFSIYQGTPHNATLLIENAIRQL